MFKIFLFMIALNPVLYVFYIGLWQLMSGEFLVSLPFLATGMICFGYLFIGVKEVIDDIKLKSNK